MLKLTQQYLHDPDNGVYGDCYRTCIACILEMPVDIVPEVSAKMWWDTDLFYEVYEHWLRSKGLATISTPLSVPLDVVFEYAAKMNLDIYYILSGTSKNGTPHCVIGLNKEIILDPAIDKSGIVSPINDYYWLTFFTTLWYKDSNKRGI